MEKNFRQTFTWLHTWTGVIVAWLLFAIFVTGTTSYYKNEITLWMQPELHKSIKSENTLDIAINKAIESSKKASTVSVSLPDSRNNTIKLMIQNTSNKNAKMQGINHSHGLESHIHGPNGQEIPIDLNNKTKPNSQKNTKASSGKNNKTTMKRKSRGEIKYFDASTGEQIKPRQTAGGNFLYRFHFELYSFPRSQSRLIVAIATMIMFIAIISGIIIHKKIFKDIFTFRPKSGPRGWMDAHILPAVAALPFLIMITYSGLILLNNSLMPWSMKALYSDNPRAYKMDMMNFNKKNEKNSIKTPQVKNSVRQVKNTINNKNLQRILNTKLQKNIKNNNSNLKRILITQNIRILQKHKKDTFKENFLTKKQIKNIIKKANEIWPQNIGYFSLIKKANSIHMEIRPKNPSTIFNFKGEKEAAVFDLKSGKIIKKSTPPSSSSIIMNTYKGLMSLHMAQFADSTLRFIFFIFGLFGVVLVGTGLVLWLKKREYKNSKKKTFGFWLVEKLNLGTIMGILIAIAIYFIANRLIWDDVANRKILEINAFFIAWALSYLHSFFRPSGKAWEEQLYFAIRLYIFIPILNAIVVFDSFSQIYNRDSILINFDLFFIFMALVFFIILSILKKKAKKQEKQC